eukprot:11552070-Alexandrium_andersonii.AAC.1
MSASLVGSEMCIRDRLGGARGPARAGPDAIEAFFRAREGAEERLRRDRHCLLYTSDAADDM